MPIVSKKSDSITARIAASAETDPSAEKTPKLKFAHQGEVRRCHDVRGELRHAGPDRRPDRVVPPDRVEDDREDGAPHDPDQEPTLDVAGHQTRRRSRTSTRNVRTSEGREVGVIVIGVPSPDHDDPAVHEADDREEQTDPDPDRQLQVHRDRVHDHLAEPREHEDR